jgi:hypothetical protein
LPSRDCAARGALRMPTLIGVLGKFTEVYLVTYFSKLFRDFQLPRSCGIEISVHHAKYIGRQLDLILFERTHSIPA